MLVVYEDVVALRCLKERIDQLAYHCPFDVLCMTVAEEKELEFIRLQCAVPLASVLT